MLRCSAPGYIHYIYNNEYEASNIDEKHRRIFVQAAVTGVDGHAQVDRIENDCIDAGNLLEKEEQDQHYERPINGGLRRMLPQRFRWFLVRFGRFNSLALGYQIADGLHLILVPLFDVSNKPFY